MQSTRLLFSLPLSLALLSSAGTAQGPAFESPGMPSISTMGQTNQFSREFNPAIGFVIDSYGDWLDREGGDDGFDLKLRLLEFNASAYIDPEAWAYVVFTSEDAESPEVEEAAVEYTGLPNNQTVKAGRFFVDFGKQMQMHLEELRTLERPLPLREYLGEELSGTGIQYDNWFALNDDTPLRFSVGAFASLIAEAHDDEHDDEPEAEAPNRKDLDEFSVSARLTAMTDAGETGQFQAGASMRYVPEFSFEFDDADLEEDDQNNVVLGLDLTYGATDESGLKTYLVGGELLWADGDLSAEVDDPDNPTGIEVVSDDALGYFLYGDYGWNQYNNVGAQFAVAETVDDPDDTANELDLYWTHHFTEMRRLRLGFTIGDDGNDDFTRVYLQFTNYFGNHSHGLNW